ncbi:ribosomal protein S5 domain 2-type protein [Neurospora hispaniola]|uniref:Ribosomal RNA-processing protein 43 n=1 Tax=Neurospora hispaniola TaxID=588809 RepID=A0AAJ0ICH5_9PEZI|nr:ribosomal protein S5 domain 2-type protein [Neurospora hispaniola]
MAATVPAPSLSFSRPTFAKLSPHPYLLTNLTDPENPCRTNGRAPYEARPVHIHTSSLAHANGSALVRTGDTTVVCGVRAEILPVTNIPQYRPREPSYGEEDNDDSADVDELKDYDLLVPNIELATGCAPQFLPGVPPTTLAQTLSTRIYSLLHSCKVVDPKGLRVWYTPPKETREEGAMEVDEAQEEEEEAEERKPELKAYWVLYIDLLFVSFDGNPFDAAWTAVMAALRDTKLPQARWDPDREAVVCSRSEEAKMALGVRGLPVACTATVFLEKEHGDDSGTSAERKSRHWILLDPDRLEESLCKETVTVVVDCSGEETKVKSIEKHGGTVIGRELMRGFIGVAEGRWQEVKEASK